MSKVLLRLVSLHGDAPPVLTREEWSRWAGHTYASAVRLHRRGITPPVLVTWRDSTRQLTERLCLWYRKATAGILAVRAKALGYEEESQRWFDTYSGVAGSQLPDSPALDRLYQDLLVYEEVERYRLRELSRT